MRTKAAVGTMIALAALFVAVGSARQTQPLPGPGTGILTVRGTVDIGNIPAVSALQEGEWKVTLARPGDVRVANTVSVTQAAPDFLKTGGRYAITWTRADAEDVTITEIGSHGWVRVDSKTRGRHRWINLTTARSVEEMP